MSFKSFFPNFSSGGHFPQRSQTILADLVEGHQKKHFCELILKSGHWSRSLAPAAILFNGAKRF